MSTTTTDVSVRNTATVQAIYEAFGQGDVPTILGHLAEDVEWERHGTDHGVPWLVPGTGKDHVVGFFERLAANLELTRFEPQAPMIGDQMIAWPILVEGRVIGNGNTFEDYDVHLWWFDDDGKVTGFRHMVDSAKHEKAFKGDA